MSNYEIGSYKAPEDIKSRSEVKEKQRLLNESGANLKVDGIWGEKTQNAYDQYLASYNTPDYTPPANENGQRTTPSSSSYKGVTPTGRNENAFVPDGSVLRDAHTAYITDSIGYFDTARNRERGRLEHVSGYSGTGYRDAKGDYYTDYGALLRTDGYFYPEGARVSPNGMYYDAGYGWQHARHAVTDTGRYVPSGFYGIRPGETVMEWNPAYDAHFESGKKQADSASVQEDVSAGWGDYFDEEIEKFKQKHYEGYGLI